MNNIFEQFQQQETTARQRIIDDYDTLKSTQSNVSNRLKQKAILAFEAIAVANHDATRNQPVSQGISGMLNTDDTKALENSALTAEVKNQPVSQLRRGMLTTVALITGGLGLYLIRGYKNGSISFNSFGDFERTFQSSAIADGKTAISVSKKALQKLPDAGEYAKNTLALAGNAIAKAKDSVTETLTNVALIAGQYIEKQLPDAKKYVGDSLESAGQTVVSRAGNAREAIANSLAAVEGILTKAGNDASRMFNEGLGPLTEEIKNISGSQYKKLFSLG